MSKSDLVTKQVEHELRRVVPTSFRVSAIQGMFDIPVEEVETAIFTAELPVIGGDWKVGVIVGPSGSGKSTIARAAYPDHYISEIKWGNKPIVDEFPKMDIQDISGVLTSVGLSSSKAWLRPYRLLSTGQQARSDLARSLASGKPVVFDEFTSTVDRTVAKAMSHAVQKHARRSGQQFVAVTCHFDVLDWLQADWVWDMTTQELARGSLQQERSIKLVMAKADRSIWPVFRDNHYLSGQLATSAQCWTAWCKLDDEDPWRLAGFFSYIPAIGIKGWRRGHRTVVLPDFQGLGIGNTMIETVAEHMWENDGLRFRAVTSSRAIIYHRMKRPEMWRCVFAPHMKAAQGKTGSINSTSAGRLTTSWEYIPTALRDSAGSIGATAKQRVKASGSVARNSVRKTRLPTTKQAGRRGWESTR